MNHKEGVIEISAGRDLYCQVWRPETDPKAVLVLVHGIGEHSDRYENLVNELVPSGYAVYTFDLQGHGRSPGQRGHIENWAMFREDLHLFCQMVSNDEKDTPVFLYGHSLGGLIALEYALHDSTGLAGLIVSNPALSLKGIPPIKIILGRIMSRIWPTFSLDTGLDVTGLSRDHVVVDTFQNDPLTHTVATARLGSEVIGAIKWTMENPERLQVPFLMMQGGADRVVPPQAGLEFFNKAGSQKKDRIVYDGYYHELHNDLEWERPVGDVLAWIDKTLGG